MPTIVIVDGEEVPFGGADLIFEATDLPGFALHVEICEDGWVAIPPSTWAALGGATVLANLSGSPVTIGKETYRKNLCTGHSARTISAHVYVAAGYGESTTDLAWDGDASSPRTVPCWHGASSSRPPIRSSRPTSTSTGCGRNACG